MGSRAGQPLDIDWRSLQERYERDPHLTYAQIAREQNISFNTVGRHAQLYGWRKPGDRAKEVTRAAARINMAAEASMLRTCREVAARVEASTLDTLKDLAPWIEKMRADHVKFIVGLSNKALKRLDTLFDTNPPHAPKDESFIAQATDKHDAIIRRNLGLSDTNPSSSLNVNVLVQGGRSLHD